MKNAIQMASCGMVYVPSFMKNGRGFQVILGDFLHNFRGYIVGIIDERDL
jgi:hypothetical protein